MSAPAWNVLHFDARRTHLAGVRDGAALRFSFAASGLAFDWGQAVAGHRACPLPFSWHAPPRRLMRGFGVIQHAPRSCRHGVASSNAMPVALLSARRVAAVAAMAAANRRAIPWSRMDAAMHELALPMASPSATHRAGHVPMAHPEPRIAAHRAGWQRAERAARAASASWGFVDVRCTPWRVLWVSPDTPAARTLVLWRDPSRQRRLLALDWQRPSILWPAHGRVLPDIVEPEPLAGLHFVFHSRSYPVPSNASIRFDARLRPRRSLLVHHTASLVTWPGLIPLPLSGAQLTLHHGDFAWSATLDIADRAAAETIAPTLNGVHEVLLTLDGWAWRLIVEGYSEDRRFGERRYQFTARGPTAYLSAPFAPARLYRETETRSAQQLAQREIADTGFALDWQVIDWILPPQTWSYQGKTPMDAIATLADAVGAIIVPARHENAFAIAYRHTIPSWEWNATPTAFELGDDLCWRLSGRFNPATQHNKIYVIGSTVGVGATRQGTAGDTPAQTIVDALLTDANAATERARQALSAGGHRLELSLECPLTPAAQAPGLIEPGRLVRLGDFSHAMTTGISISANWSEDSGLQIHQTVSLERAQ